MADKVLVTGATGLVGRHLVEALAAKGFAVRALVRHGSDLQSLEGLACELVRGDVRDAPAMERAVEGCVYVFHAAALVSAWEARREEVWAVNVQGSAHVARACAKAGVKRLIHVSSAAAVGYTDDPADTLHEDSPYNFEGRGFLYQDSKWEAEKAVLRALPEVEVVIGNPTLIFGAWDRHFNAARLLRMARRGGLIVYPPGGVGVVWVRDVADGLIKAAERGRPGRRYILNGENLSYRDLFRLIGRIVHRPAGIVPLSRSMLEAGALLTEPLARLLGHEPALTTSRAMVLSVYQYASDHRAREELGYEPSIARPALEDTAAWLSAHHLW